MQPIKPSSTQNIVSQQAQVVAQISTHHTGSAVSHAGICSSTYVSWLRNLLINAITAQTVILKIVLLY